MVGEHFQDGRRKDDGSLGGLGFGRCDDQFSLYIANLLGDGERALLEIDVSPLQTDYLATA